jgi:hypothetical protein
VQDEKPITDKENFPPSESKGATRLVVEMAYVDGLADGYRKAVTDFLLWSMAFMIVVVLARSISVES